MCEIVEFVLWTLDVIAECFGERIQKWMLKKVKNPQERVLR